MEKEIPMNMKFIEFMHTLGDAKCIILNSQCFTYRNVVDGIQRWESEFSNYGITQGSVVALEGEYSLDMVTAMLALFSRGVIVIPISPNAKGERTDYYEIAHVEWTVFINIKRNLPPYSIKRRIASQNHSIEQHPLYHQIIESDHAGLVLFSSGTTGSPKASLLDVHKMIARYSDNKRPQIILAFLSLDHIGGINTLLHTLSNGGVLVTVTERNPRTVFEAIQNHRVQVLPTTPTFLNMILLSDVCKKYNTSSLELITYGTEPMPQRTLDIIKITMPHVRLKQTYGLTELGIMPTKSKGNGSLWMKLGGSGFDYKILENILWVKSNMAMLGYLNAESPIDSDGYFNTQDVVLVDGDYVQILGRKSEIINVGGEKVYPNEVENVLLTMPNVAAVRVNGYPSHITGYVIRATFQLVEYEDIGLFKVRVREHCKTHLAPFKIPVVIEVTQSDLHSERFKMIRSGTTV